MCVQEKSGCDKKRRAYGRTWTLDEVATVSGLVCVVCDGRPRPIKANCGMVV